MVQYARPNGSSDPDGAWNIAGGAASFHAATSDLNNSTAIYQTTFDFSPHTIQLDLDNTISFSGHPSWKILKVKDDFSTKGALIKTLLLKELISNGILINASHNLSYSHKKEDLKYVISIYDKVIKNLKIVLQSKTREIDFPAIEPIFLPRKIL